ncbi:short-subunit dehydrogenase [Flavobacterium nitrogenifigens]|uniref:Short-subunit dehydrogenase n=2 Tax=Flavobacterium TaxID=237 RepID=A0A7W7NAK3_9FLAO|nr:MULTISPECIES: SDR family oxidoreductase [Flavobacterium]MBB4804604.1 short-subunit dehydrogenase [Flavobacterium nitrogenifigens]MBB6389563.1 short-subunit dehydrogenase [Flavobacterium notoginsengisoli]
MKKTIFITGASSGLGKAAAKLFQTNGWNVIATMRKPENETELTKLENVKVIKLDVTNSSQISETINQVLSMQDVDVVLNNAGYGLIGPLESFSEEQINNQLQTNLFGVINVTKAFVPFFRERKKGVFINITSTFGLLGYPTCSLYNASKFAVDGFSEGLAYELAQFGIQVKIVAPGGMQTDFAGRSLQGGLHEAYKQLIAKVSEGYSEEQIANYTKAETVAQIIYDAATDEKNQLRYVAGKDANELYNERLSITPENQFQKMRSQFLM